MATNLSVKKNGVTIDLGGRLINIYSKHIQLLTTRMSAKTKTKNLTSYYRNGLTVFLWSTVKINQYLLVHFIFNQRSKFYFLVQEFFYYFYIQLNILKMFLPVFKNKTVVYVSAQNICLGVTYHVNNLIIFFI